MVIRGATDIVVVFGYVQFLLLRQRLGVQAMFENGFDTPVTA
jgi:hypothetical protein